MSIPIADLHCDLLCYLQSDSKRTPYDSVVRCSIPQLLTGHVKLQTFAIFVATGSDSVRHGLAQVNLYKNLSILYPEYFMPIGMLGKFNLTDPRIATAIAFEGASAFCDEYEPIQLGLDRLKAIISQVEKPAYISLTWNTENRFGGGALTQIGLKEDGKRLLDELAMQQIPIDLSHASDALAYDIFTYLDRHEMKVPVIASHSNARAVKHVPRNLPDDIAKEIFLRQGVIGLNVYRPFIGDQVEAFTSHLAHWLQLGNSKQICFGTDFFYEGDVPLAYQSFGEKFFSDYQDASCYGRLLELFRQHLGLKAEELENLAYKNVLNFLKAINLYH